MFRPGAAEDLVTDDLHQPQLPPPGGLHPVQLGAGPGLGEHVGDGGVPVVGQTRLLYHVWGLGTNLLG